MDVWKDYKSLRALVEVHFGELKTEMLYLTECFKLRNNELCGKWFLQKYITLPRMKRVHCLKNCFTSPVIL